MWCLYEVLVRRRSGVRLGDARMGREGGGCGDRAGRVDALFLPPPLPLRPLLLQQTLCLTYLPHSRNTTLARITHFPFPFGLWRNDVSASSETAYTSLGNEEVEWVGEGAGGWEGVVCCGGEGLCLSLCFGGGTVVCQSQSRG